MKKCPHMFSAGISIAGHNYTEPKPQLIESAELETLEFKQPWNTDVNALQKVVRPKPEDK